jgi:hypothetical protein
LISIKLIKVIIKADEKSFCGYEVLLWHISWLIEEKVVLLGRVYHGAGRDCSG